MIFRKKRQRDYDGRLASTYLANIQKKRSKERLSSHNAPIFGKIGMQKRHGNGLMRRGMNHQMDSPIPYLMAIHMDKQLGIQFLQPPMVRLTTKFGFRRKENKNDLRGLMICLQNGQLVITN